MNTKRSKTVSASWIAWIMLGCFFPGLPLAAEDWPEFRGPTGQGISTASNLPTQWGPQSNVVWKVGIAGKGWSSPVVIGERLYLTTAVPAGGEELPAADRSLRVICLDALSGRTLWDREVFQQKGSASPRIHSKNSHASPTPVFDKGRLFVHFGHQGTACLDAMTGETIWSTSEFRYQPVHGNGSSPVLAGDVLVFSADGAQDPSVIALDKDTGKLKWKFARQSTAKKKFSFCTPLLIEVNRGAQLITVGSGVVNALDPRSGREIWRVRFDEGYSVVPRPVFAQGLVFLSTGYDNPVAMAIRPDGKGDVTNTHVAWTIAKHAPHNPSMLVVDDLLYMVADNGVLTCAEARTGKVLYQERATGPISASPLHAGGRVYLQDEAGTGVVVTAGRNFQVVARNRLGERSLASYAVCGNDLLIRTQGSLYRIGGRR